MPLSVQAIEKSSPLPIISQEEVTRHRSLKDGVWVTYQGGVYDITEFVSIHPGGEKIMMAAGGAIEPFWSLYAVHNQEHVLEILSEYKVRNPLVSVDLTKALLHTKELKFTALGFVIQY